MTGKIKIAASRAKQAEDTTEVEAAQEVEIEGGSDVTEPVEDTPCSTPAPKASADDLPAAVEPSAAPADATSFGKGGVYRSIGRGLRVRK